MGEGKHITRVLHGNPPQGQQIKRHAPLRLRGESRSLRVRSPEATSPPLPWLAPDRRGASQGVGHRTPSLALGTHARRTAISKACPGQKAEVTGGSYVGPPPTLRARMGGGGGGRGLWLSNHKKKDNSRNRGDDFWSVAKIVGGCKFQQYK